MLGLGTPAAAVAQCKQYVVQIPCEAQAGLHKLRTKLEGSSVRGLAQPLSQALDDLQVYTQTLPLTTAHSHPHTHTFILRYSN